MKPFIGIDVSSKDLQVAITDSENYQKPIINRSFSNDLIGANEVKKIILQLAKKASYDKIIVGMEATSIYSFHPAYFLANDQDLQKLNLETDVLYCGIPALWQVSRHYRSPRAILGSPAPNADQI